MCGICGIVGMTDNSLISEMVSSLSHRGPDKTNIINAHNSSFAFARLAIIDLENGMQPMFNETGEVLTMINGQIYNYEEIRSSLEKKGHRFNTKCDSEVLPHLYEEYSENFANYLNGMFAFAIYSENKLILGRDRLGQKPLYYFQHKDLFLFASEIKSLLKFKDIKYTFNHRFAYPHSYFELENDTFITEIKQVKPGHILIYEEGKQIVEKPYWRLPTEAIYDNEEEVARKLKETLDDSVRLRMRSDVPVGVLLSGGLDSNIILNLAAKYSNNITTYTVGSSKNSEIDIARRVAEYYSTEHHEVVFDVDDMHKALPAVVWGVESCEPRTIDTSIPMFHVINKAKEKVRVLLCGEGADEIFCGYQNYFSKLKTNDQNQKESIRHTSTLYNLNLRRVDGIAMSQSIEARCPFLDYRVVELALKTNPSLKINDIEKYILRKSFQNDIGEYIIKRPKTNFNVGTGILPNWEQWLKNNLSSKVLNRLRIKEIQKSRAGTWQAMDNKVFYKYMLLLSNLFYEMFIEGNEIKSIEELWM